MNRKVLREFTHVADRFLKIDNSNYKQWVFRYTFLELEKDLGTKGDITSKALFKDNRIVEAKITAKSPGILAGKQEIEYFLVGADPQFRRSLQGVFEVEFLVEDGEQFSSGDEILRIKAGVLDLLAVERVVLNLLGRMCGVATFTAGVVERVKEFGVLVVPTRKTLWGWLDKRAVFLGGGGTHRLNLADAVLVKENHLAVFDGDWGTVLDAIIMQEAEERFVEVEVEKPEDVFALCEAAHERLLSGALRSPVVVMMDNFKAEEVVLVMERVQEEKYYEKILFEASGGIEAESVMDYAKSGVDIISMGTLTSGVAGVDLSMRIVER